MMYRFILIAFAAWISLLCGGVSGEVRMATTEMAVILENGHLRSLTALNTGVEYLAKGQSAPLLALRVKGGIHAPDTMVWEEERQCAILRYEKAGITAEVSMEAKASHIVFELVSLTPEEPVELIIWGPYPITINRIIGETIGVVRGQDFAIGVQALNAKTLGGYPSTEDDVMPMYNIFDHSNYSDISLEFKDKQIFRGNTAMRTPFGSVIQAYCRSRAKDRVIANWGHETCVAPAFDDGGVGGSKIALFGCPPDRALGFMGKIELAEGLPHPMLDGIWGKIARGATASYLIMPFGEQNIDQAIALTKRAGLKYLYHGGPFQTWGHFKLNPKQFPDNWKSLGRCVEKAHNAGVRVGVHTLSNFITTNDAYVTPVPDSRLARVGSTVLSENISRDQTEIPVKDPSSFVKKTHLNAAVIGKEIVRYKAVSEQEPWRLLGCERGAWATTASARKAGGEIGKLMDHAYKVFLTNTDLSLEVAARIADLFNQTGLMQISLDGLEGNWSTGMGQYGRTLFTKAWHDRLSHELSGKVINDASNPGHFSWHIYTRMNWGEPWYAGFRESQTLYRLKNQAYYSRNLMPRMLGWFKMTESTSLEDAEWLLARAAGFDAGFSLVTSPKTVEKNGIGEEILEAVRQWESARMEGAFPSEFKGDLQNIEKEFHLVVEKGVRNLFPVHSVKEKLIQKGPTGTGFSSSYTIVNPYESQPLQYIIQNVSKGKLKNLTLGIAGGKKLDLKLTLEPGQILKFSKGNEAVVFEKNWLEKTRVPLEGRSLTVASGRSILQVSGAWNPPKDGALKIELRTFGPPRVLENK